MEKLFKLNGRYFYAIEKCKRGNHTLCVASRPWGESSWGDGPNGQLILNMVDNCNANSLTFAWYQSLPYEIKMAMLTVSVATNDYDQNGKGELKATEMFVPSNKEWDSVPKEILELILVRTPYMWSRSFSGCYDSHDYYAWAVNNGGTICTKKVSRNQAVIPAFYLEESVLQTILKEQESESAGAGNSAKLAARICDCISDGYDDEEYREDAETQLYNELSQLPADSTIKDAFVALCERIEDLEVR